MFWIPKSTGELIHWINIFVHAELDDERDILLRKCCQRSNVRHVDIYGRSAALEHNRKANLLSGSCWLKIVKGRELTSTTLPPSVFAKS